MEQSVHYLLIQVKTMERIAPFNGSRIRFAKVLKDNLLDPRTTLSTLLAQYS